jgi:hypothetical protein
MRNGVISFVPALAVALGSIGFMTASGALACAPLSRSSKIVLRVPLSKSEEGVRLRIRTEYVRPGSDISNVNNDSAWQYLMVEN